MNQKNLSKLASLTFGVLVLSFLIGFYTIAAWQEPGQPPPGGNVELPINVGSDPQTKTGILGIGARDDTFSLTVEVAGKKGIKVTGNSWFQGTATTTGDFCLNTGRCLSTTGGGAPVGAPYVTYGLIDELTAERVLVAGAGLSSTTTATEFTLNIGQGTGISVAADSISVDITWADARYVNEGQANSITSAMIVDGSITSADVDTSSLQRRVTGTCLGQVMVSINADGTVTCEADDTGAGGGAPTDASYVVMGLNGTLTAERVLTQGTGISISDGGAGGAVTIASTLGTSIDSAEIVDGTITYSDTNVDSVQRRVSGTCGAGSSIRIIYNDGTVTCETDDVGGITACSDCNGTFVNEGQANSITSAMISDGTITYSDTNVDSVQRRVSSSCSSGSSIRVINNNGTVTCETDDTGAGTLTCSTYYNTAAHYPISCGGTLGCKYSLDSPTCPSGYVATGAGG